MALDKVIDSAQLDADLTAVADVIRTKGGTSEALSFPDGFVSAVEGIQAGGGDALTSFMNRSLTSISVDELTIIEGSASLNGCKKLISARFPNVVTLRDGTFGNCTALTDVYLPKVTYFPKYVFQNCSALKFFDFSKVTYIGNESVHNCTSLLSDNLDFGNLKSCGSGLFQGCTSLEELKLPVLGGIFYTNLSKGCTALKKVVIGTSEKPTSFSIDRGGCFNDCPQLEVLVLHVASVPALKVTDSFLNSGIANGTGYIYVPSALVDSFKSATNWSTYADQIRAIEDYPEICGEVSA